MEYLIYITKNKIELPKRGYFTKGDESEYIGIIASFLALNFIGFEAKVGVKIEDMLGNIFGNNLIVWVKEFQRCNNLEVDGNIGPITLNKLREYGLSL